MGIAAEDALKKQLASKKNLPAYILFGDDGYLKKMYTDRIAALAADKDDFFNYQRFGSDCDLQEVYDAAVQLPVMADKKCVILCDYDFEHCSKADFDKLCRLLEEAENTAVLIIWFDSIEIDPKKNSKFKKLVSAAEKSGGTAVQLNHRKNPELVKMLTDGAAKRGCHLEASAARYLIEAVGADINILKNELDKLCFYVGHGDINKSQVDFVCTKTLEASVYNLSKQIIALETSAAVKTLDELFYMRTEPMVILYTVSSVFIDIYRVYLCRKKGKQISEAASIYGYKGREFVLERAAQNLSKLDRKKINLCLTALLEADRQLKSNGGEPRVILEQLIIRLIYIIAKGETVDKA